MGRKENGQKLQKTALAKDRNVRLPVADVMRRSTLQRTKHYLALHMLTEQMFLACAKPPVARFKSTARSQTRLNHSGHSDLLGLKNRGIEIHAVKNNVSKVKNRRGNKQRSLQG